MTQVILLLMPRLSAFAADVNTFSIVAHDPANVDWGVAVASKYFSVGSVVPWAEADVGAVATEASVNVGYGPRGLELLRQGMAAKDALTKLLAEDKFPPTDGRQLASIDRKGNVATYTGANAAKMGRLSQLRFSGPLREACLRPLYMSGPHRPSSRNPIRPRSTPVESVFDRVFLEDLRFWVKTDRGTALRVLDLVEATARDPFQGMGKPGLLRYELARCWLRRITQEHRMVYRVNNRRIDFLQARYHYLNHRN